MTNAKKESFEWVNRETLKGLPEDRLVRFIAKTPMATDHRKDTNIPPSERKIRIYPVDELKLAARSLIFRPIGLNHEKVISEAIVVDAEWSEESQCVECFALLPKEYADKVREGKITDCSVGTRSRTVESIGDMETLRGIFFDEISLLESKPGEQLRLPGDKYASVEPFFKGFKESIAYRCEAITPDDKTTHQRAVFPTDKDENEETIKDVKGQPTHQRNVSPKDKDEEKISGDGKPQSQRNDKPSQADEEKKEDEAIVSKKPTVPARVVSPKAPDEDEVRPATADIDAHKAASPEEKKEEEEDEDEWGPGCTREESEAKLVKAKARIGELEEAFRVATSVHKETKESVTKEIAEKTKLAKLEMVQKIERVIPTEDLLRFYKPGALRFVQEIKKVVYEMKLQ